LPGSRRARRRLAAATTAAVRFDLPRRAPSSPRAYHREARLASCHARSCSRRSRAGFACRSTLTEFWHPTGSQCSNVGPTRVASRLAARPRSCRARSAAIVGAPSTVRYARASEQASCQTKPSGDSIAFDRVWSGYRRARSLGVFLQPTRAYAQGRSADVCCTSPVVVVVRFFVRGGGERLLEIVLRHQPDPRARREAAAVHDRRPLHARRGQSAGPAGAVVCFAVSPQTRRRWHRALLRRQPKTESQ
jgi:hypothetical protein